MCAVALSIKVLNSVGVRSLIERKCRGAEEAGLPGLSVVKARTAADTFDVRLKGRMAYVVIILAQVLL